MSNNRQDNYPFKFLRKTPPYRVFATWEVQYECNYKCSYCHAPKPGQPNVRNRANLSREEWLKVWTKMYEKYGTWEIIMSGGEPFAYPGFLDIAIALSKIHILEFCTNLFWDVEPFIREVDPARVKVGTSYHPEFADMDTFIKKARALKDAGFNPIINFVPWPPLLDKMLYCKEKMEGAGLQFVLQPYIGMYEGRQYPQGYTKSERDYFKVFKDDCNVKTIKFKIGEDALNDEFKTRPPEVKEGQDKKEVAPNNEKKNKVQAAGTKNKLCRMGQNYVFIHPDGATSRCCRDHAVSLGNLVDGTLELWDEPRPCLVDECNCWRCMLVERPDEFYLKHWGRREINRLAFGLNKDKA